MLVPAGVSVASMGFTQVLFSYIQNFLLEQDTRFCVLLVLCLILTSSPLSSPRPFTRSAEMTAVYIPGKVSASLVCSGHRML